MLKGCRQTETCSKWVWGQDINTGCGSIIGKQWWVDLRWTWSIMVMLKGHRQTEACSKWVWGQDIHIGCSSIIRKHWWVDLRYNGQWKATWYEIYRCIKWNVDEIALNVEIEERTLTTLQVAAWLVPSAFMVNDSPQPLHFQTCQAIRGLNIQN